MPRTSKTIRTPRRALLAAHLLALALLALPAGAQAVWKQPVGGASPINIDSSRNAEDQSLTTIGGVPYVAWVENDGTNSEVRVSRLNAAGTAWEQLGAGASPINHSSTRNATGASLAGIGGIPYVAWAEYDGTNHEVRVSRLNASGTAWEQVVGGASPINHAANQTGGEPSLIGIEGVPYVAWVEHDATNREVRVSRLNATGTAWEQVVGGASPINASPVAESRRPSLASIGGVPHVAWQEADALNTEIRVSRLNAAGTDWQEVVGGGSPINNDQTRDAEQPSLTSIGGVPHVAWRESDGPNLEVRVSRLNDAGTAWQQVVGGASPINQTPGTSAYEPSLIGIDGVPYVAWRENEGNDQVRVSRLNAAGTAWQQVVGGASPINQETTADAIDPSLAASGGVPYVAWSELDGTNLELRVSRLEPEFISQSATPSATGANLEAQVRTFGVAYPVAFEHGTDAGFGPPTATQRVTSGNVDAVTVSQAIAGLPPATVHLWRPFATDLTRRTAVGPTSAFTTLAMPANPDPAADRTAPQTRIEKGPKGKTARRIARFRFTSSEPGSRFECKLDKREFVPCKSPRQLKRLRPGKHTFVVRAIDAGGNVDRSPARRRWRVVR